MTDSNTTNNNDITELLAELKKGFVADIPEKLDAMESLILLMEQNEEFSENYEALYRLVHSLKGTAGTYGLHFITSVCHVMEDILNEVGKNSENFNQYGGTYWLSYIDLLRTILSDLEKSQDNFSAYEGVLNKLQSTTPSGSRYEYQCMVVTTSGLYESLIPTTFNDKNIRFSFCGDGYEALGRLLSENYDIVISDYEMPFLNGLAIFGALRLSDGRNKDVKTVLLTSGKQKEHARQTDPDIVIYKDKHFTENLIHAIQSVIK
ncbi:MAG: Hpt domain-containing protein [Gammaproteobacteria bacterium]|nr:Hpt domain-containing protein [Gammaproteobacteria bacterium]